MIPLHHTPAELPQKRFAYYWVSIFARRAPGVSEAAAAARIAAVAPALLEESVPLRYNEAQRRNYLANRLVVSSARTGVDWMMRNRFGRPLYALLGISVAILLIACLNLSGLLVARTHAREKELAIRVAIGATWWRIMRPLAFESIFLALACGLTGVLFASWASRAIATQASAMFPNFRIDTSLDVRAFIFLAGVLGWIAAVLAIVPAWKAQWLGRISLQVAGRGIAGDGSRMQKALIGVQVAFTLALVIAAGFFSSSFASLARLPLGLRVQGVAEATLSPLPGGYSFTGSKSYYRSLLDRVASVPGVEAASLSSFALYWQKQFPEPVRSDDGARELRAQTIRISHGYFRTIGVNLHAGEDFNPDHTEASQSSANP